MTSQEKAISIVGLGKLGTPFALAFARVGYKVYGVDVNITDINMLRKRTRSIYEKSVNSLLKSQGDRLSISNTYDNLALYTDITFVIVPTPSEQDGSFSLNYLLQVIDKLGAALLSKKKKHTVVITSTVSPRSLEKTIMPRLELISKKNVGKDIGLCYCPEFIALGSIVQNLTNPELILIGESDKQSGTVVKKIRLSICKNKPRIVRTNWVNAEIAKIALNTYITTKISFANMIARLAEKVPGADSHVITDAIGSDSRVGQAYFKGGMGFGGPCFPRDNGAFASFLVSMGQDSIIPKSIQSFNRQQTDSIFERIEKYLPKKGGMVGVLGLSYKAETDVIEESASISLIQKLISKGIQVITYDPSAMGNTQSIFSRIQYARSAKECIDASNVVILATAWQEFVHYPWKSSLAHTSKTIIDCWGCLDTKSIASDSITYISLGSYIQ